MIYQDEVEIHRHPTLARIWAPVGTQPEVPAPGQNEKTVAYGGVNYATGRITYTIAPTKSGANFLAFLNALVRAYPGRKIRLVCDNGRFHHTKAVKQWLEKQSPVNFPKGRIRIFAHGQMNPVAPNSTPQGRALNRRVEVVLGTTAK